MARVTLELPRDFPYATELEVRISDINYGNHLGNDRLLSLLHEARVRFLAAQGWRELDVAGLGLIISDVVIVYRSEAFLGEVLRVELAPTDFNKYGCDLCYRVTARADGREVARAKTGIVFFDYANRRVQRVPEVFLARFGPGVVV